MFLSATFFEMIVNGRIARPVEDLDEDTLRAIAQAKVSGDYAELDDILKDWAS